MYYFYTIMMVCWTLPPSLQVPITVPRPVVLLGGCENEVRQGLVKQGVIDGIKFAFCKRGVCECVCVCVCVYVWVGVCVCVCVCVCVGGVCVCINRMGMVMI